ncbi:hypothetical protein SKAU_G00021990 [Synaphobranchus kaupii]|uniref:Uncharacterized protein n=1 Tax=Synaphobranchus kaupii TaxID=118154 RepID=A0A9Q1GBZ0_SYNKA|nr:hypothetical protein SKAU_G00021990 [Synaphobranchus kaupii]
MCERCHISKGRVGGKGCTDFTLNQPLRSRSWHPRSPASPSVAPQEQRFSGTYLESPCASFSSNVAGLFQKKAHLEIGWRHVSNLSDDIRQLCGGGNDSCLQGWQYGAGRCGETSCILPCALQKCSMPAVQAAGSDLTNS